MAAMEWELGCLLPAERKCAFLPHGMSMARLGVASAGCGMERRRLEWLGWEQLLQVQNSVRGNTMPLQKHAAALVLRSTQAIYRSNLQFSLPLSLSLLVESWQGRLQMATT